MVIASMVGYLGEVAATESMAAVFDGWNLIFVLLGLVAAALSAALWGASRVVSARRGVFVHAVAHAQLARHQGEDLLLRAKVASTWPSSVVMGFRPIQIPPVAGGGLSTAVCDSRYSAAHELANIVVEQAVAASVASPAFASVTILPAGTPETMVWAGARTHHCLPSRFTTVRCASDDTSSSREPFLDFVVSGGARALRGRQPAARWRHIMDGSATSVASAPTTASAQPAKSAVLLLLPETCSYQAVFDHPPDCVHIDAPLWVVDYPSPIAEKDAAYQAVINDVSAALVDMKNCGVEAVFIQGAGPSSLLFAAGYVADAAGLQVGSMPFDAPGRVYRMNMARLADTQPTPTAVVQAGSARSWWATVVARSLALAVSLPLLGAAVASVLEWLVAGSRAGEDCPSAVCVRGVSMADWAFIGAIFIIAGLVMIVATRWWGRMLDDPRVTIAVFNQEAADAPDGGLRSRRLVLPPVPQVSAEATAKQIVAAFCDVLSGLPGVTSWSIDLGTKESCPQAEVVVSDMRWGLQKALRASQPVCIEWEDGSGHDGSSRCRWRTGPDAGVALDGDRSTTA